MSYRCNMDALGKTEIAALVRTGRTAKGYTQQELADRTCVTLRSIQRIEKGDVLPREYTLRLLEQQLGITIGTGTTPVQNIGPGARSEAKVIRDGDIPARDRQWSKGRKWILTGSLGLLIPLLTIAFIAQSARWPETDFERILLWSSVLIVYSAILWKIWK